MAWIIVPIKGCELSVCSQASEESTSDSDSGAKLFAIVKSTHMPLGFSLRTGSKVLWMLRLFGTILKLSDKPSLNDLCQLTVSTLGSPAKILVALEKEQVSKRNSLWIVL